MKRIKLSLVIVLTFIGINLSAQDEVSLYAGFGSGIEGGVSYLYSFSPKWGLRSGLVYSQEKQSQSFSLLEDKYEVPTPTSFPSNSKFDYYTRLDNYKEEQTLLYLNVPIMAQFQTTTKHNFYAAAGVMVGIPLSLEYTASATNLTTKGYSHYTAQWYDNLPQQGFTSLDKYNNNGKLTQKLSVSMALELGMKWRFINNIPIYTGFYFNYGLNDIYKSKAGSHLIEYNANQPSEIKGNSILQAQTNNNALKDKYRFQSYGIKIGVGFTIDKKKKDKVSPNIIEPEFINPYLEPINVDEEEPLNNDMAYEFDMLALAQPINRYESGVTEINRIQQIVLEEKIEILNRYPDMKILIEGFTSGEEDAHIGLERATVVKTYLVNRGITPNNIQIENRGKSMQLIEEINEECRLKNRRIVITNTHRN